MVKTSKTDENVETPTSKASYVKVVTGADNPTSPSETSRGSSLVATNEFKLNQSNKEKKREKARLAEVAQSDLSVRTILQEEIVKANAETQAASDREAEADRKVVEQAEEIRKLREQMDKATTQTRVLSTASTPVRGETSQAKAVDTQAEDKLELEDGEEMEGSRSSKDANADLNDPDSDIGGEKGKSLANLNANGEVSPAYIPPDSLPAFNKLLHGIDRKSAPADAIYRTYEQQREMVALAGGPVAYAVHQIDLVLPAKFDAKSVDLQANIALARQRHQHLHPNHKLLQIVNEKGKDWDDVDHVKKFASDIVRYAISPWLWWDCIDEKSHRSLKSRLTLRQFTTGMSVSDLDYMSWPPSEMYTRYTNYGYPVGTAKVNDYYDAETKMATIKAIIATFPATIQACEFDLKLEASQQRQIMTFMENERLFEGTVQNKEFLTSATRQKEIITFILMHFKRTTLHKAVAIYALLLEAQKADRLNNLDDYWEVMLQHFARLGQATLFYTQYHRIGKTEMTSKELKDEHRKNNAGRRP
jgi:hypothetical protein